MPNKRIFFNKGVPLARTTREALQENGITVLKRRDVQKKRGIVINHGNYNCKIDAEMVINPPNLIYQTGVTEAAKRCGDLMPDVRFKFEDVDYLPFIAKRDGMKGHGKVIVQTEEESRQFNPRGFSIFQRFLVPPTLEYRIVVYRGQCIAVYKKELEDKYNPECVKEFRLCGEGQHYKPLPQRVIDIALDAASRFDLDLLGVDLLFSGSKLKGQPGYVLEVNSAPGMGSHFTIPKLIEAIYADLQNQQV